jgi:hypothetical protein
VVLSLLTICISTDTITLRIEMETLYSNILSRAKKNNAKSVLTVKKNSAHDKQKDFQQNLDNRVDFISQL